MKAGSTPAQLEFVRNRRWRTTPAETLIVIVMHIPIVNVIDPQENYDRLVNFADLFALFEGRKYTVSFSGHTHTTEHHYFDAALTALQNRRGLLSSCDDGALGCGGVVLSPPSRGVARADSRDGSRPTASRS